MGLVWTEGKNGEKKTHLQIYDVGVLLENIDRGRKSKIERQRAGWGREGRRGGLSLISVHVCFAVFLQGFLVSFSRHQRVHSQGSDANGSVKGAYVLWPG